MKPSEKQRRIFELIDVVQAGLKELSGLLHENYQVWGYDEDGYLDGSGRPPLADFERGKLLVEVQTLKDQFGVVVTVPKPGSRPQV